MKSIRQFLRTTLLGGLFLLLPIVALVLLLGKAYGFAHKLIDPLASYIPVKSIIGLQTPMLLAVCVMVLVCFLAGLIAQRAHAQRIMRRLEEAVLSKIPGYERLRSTRESMLEVQNQQADSVVLVRFDDSWQIGLRIEELENGLVTVFVPGAPSPQSGSIYFMTADRIMISGIPITSMMKCLEKFGGGSNTLMSSISVEGWPTVK